MQVVYVDEVFLLNAFLDALLLKTAARLGGIPVSGKRLFIASLFGGVFALLVAVYPPAGGKLWQLLAGVLLGLVAFWGQRYLLRQLLLFFLVSGAYAGIVLGSALFWEGEMEPSLWLLLMSVGFGALLCGGVFARFALHGGSKGDLRRVSLTYRGKTVTFTALYDSGNTLTQPDSGGSLMVVDSRALRPLWDTSLSSMLTEAALQRPEETMEKLKAAGYDKCFTLWHYRTASDPKASMLLVKTQLLQVGRAVIPDSWVGLSPFALTDGGGYCALWGGKEEDDEVVKSFAGKMGAFLKRKADVHRRQRCAAATPGSAAGAAGAGKAGTGSCRPAIAD